MVIMSELFQEKMFIYSHNKQWNVQDQQGMCEYFYDNVCLFSLRKFHVDISSDWKENKWAAIARKNIN